MGEEFVWGGEDGGWGWVRFSGVSGRHRKLPRDYALRGNDSRLLLAGHAALLAELLVLADSHRALLQTNETGTQQNMGQGNKERREGKVERGTTVRFSTLANAPKSGCNENNCSRISYRVKSGLLQE